MRPLALAVLLVLPIIARADPVFRADLDLCRPNYLGWVEFFRFVRENRNEVVELDVTIHLSAPGCPETSIRRELTEEDGDRRVFIHFPFAIHAEIAEITGRQDPDLFSLVPDNGAGLILLVPKGTPRVASPIQLNVEGLEDRLRGPLLLRWGAEDAYAEAAILLP